MFKMALTISGFLTRRNKEANNVNEMNFVSEDSSILSIICERLFQMVQCCSIINSALTSRLMLKTVFRMLLNIKKLQYQVDSIYITILKMVQLTLRNYSIKINRPYWSQRLIRHFSQAKLTCSLSV